MPHSGWIIIIFGDLYECIAIIRLNLTVTHYTGDIGVDQADCIEIQVSHKFDVKNNKNNPLTMYVDWFLKWQQTTVPKSLLQVFTYYTTFKPRGFMLLPLKMGIGHLSHCQLRSTVLFFLCVMFIMMRVPESGKQQKVESSRLYYTSSHRGA